MPLETERGYGVHLPHAELELRLPVVLCDYNVSVAQAGTGVQITGIDELASVSAPANYALADRLVRAAKLVFPELRTDDARPWMHCRPSMPDSLPVIGAVPGYPNAYLAFGHGHKGLGLAGITGQLVRELVDGEATSIEIEPYSPLRFARRRRAQLPPGRRIRRRGLMRDQPNPPATACRYMRTCSQGVPGSGGGSAMNGSAALQRYVPPNDAAEDVRSQAVTPSSRSGLDIG